MNESNPSPEERVPENGAGERPTRNRSGIQSPGEMLREARLANDFSVEDLCAETKLSEKSIQALEDNRFNELSQPIFAGGYYRQCAKVLGIDTDRMMEAYAAWGGKKTSSQTAQPAAVDVVPQDVTPPNWRAFGMIGLLVLLLVVAGVFVFAPDTNTLSASGEGETAVLSGGNTDSAGGTTTIGSGNSSATGGGSARSSRDTGTSLRVSPGPGTTPSSAAVEPPRTGQRAGGRNVNETLGINPRGQRDAQPEKPVQPEVAPNQLVVNFTDRSWVDIRDANGSRLLTGIYEAGDSHEFEAETPYRITLGFAPGVEMTIGGEPVDIASQTTINSTARLTVEARDS